MPMSTSDISKMLADAEKVKETPEVEEAPEVEEEEDKEDIDLSKFNSQEVIKGLDCEADHDLDIETTKALIKDHLEEDPMYYTHLEAMEAKYSKGDRKLG